MTEHQTDATVLKHIESLVHEEQHLYGHQTLDEGQQRRLDAIKVELDQYWDLLRQRRARREFGQDPDQAHVRPKSIVENYEQ